MVVLVELTFFSSGKGMKLLLVSMVSFTFWGLFAPRKRVVFFGDSITQMATQPDGYITQLSQKLKTANQAKDYELIGAGISGNKVPDLQVRLQRDVLSRKPDMVFVYIGINDVWHYFYPGCKDQGGTPKDCYANGLKDLMNQLKATGCWVVLCTPSVIGEAKASRMASDAMLDEYAAISRQIATETAVELCDLHKAFREYLDTHNPQNLDQGILTTDGVHLNREGNRLVASEMWKFLSK